jgi:hypothetical protein
VNIRATNTIVGSDFKIDEFEVVEPMKPKITKTSETTKTFHYDINLYLSHLNSKLTYAK